MYLHRILALSSFAVFTITVITEPVLGDCAPATPCTEPPVVLGTLGGSGTMAYALSVDGMSVVGESYLAGDTTFHAFRWTAAGGMTDLGTLGGSWSYAGFVSADGTVVVGGSILDGTPGSRVFRWTEATGMVDIGTLGGATALANAISTDGSVIVGSSPLSGSNLSHAFRWTLSDGMAALGTLGGSWSLARDVSGDGAVVVGEASLLGDMESRAFRWTESGGMLDLGSLGGSSSSARRISADGSVIVGEAYTAGNVEYHAFRWTAADGMVDLGTLGGSYSNVFAISADGGVVIGQSFNTGDTTLRGYRWTVAEGMTDLGSLGGTWSNPTGLSSGGTVIVGESATAGDDETHAFRWTEAGGMQNLNTLLVDAGIDMSGILLESAQAVSADGRIILGQAMIGDDVSPYLVRYDETTSAPGMTTPGSVLSSLDALMATRLGLLASHHRFAAPLLGQGKPIARNSEAGVYGFTGAAGGAFAHYAVGGGLAVLGGIGYGRQDESHAELKNSVTAAVALRYVHGNQAWRPFAEAGGWIAPDGRLSLTRTYANGAGIAVGAGHTDAKLSYAYARKGLVWHTPSGHELAAYGEIGRLKLDTDAYGEAQSETNPFEAYFEDAEEAMTLAKVGAQWTFGITDTIDATLWGAAVWDLRRSSDMVALVPGVGAVAPKTGESETWAEFGARLGYRASELVSFDIFANGMASDAFGTGVHVGVDINVMF